MSDAPVPVPVGLQTLLRLASVDLPAQRRAEDLAAELARPALLHAHHRTLDELVAARYGGARPENGMLDASELVDALESALRERQRAR